MRYIPFVLAILLVALVASAASAKGPRCGPNGCSAATATTSAAPTNYAGAPPCEVCGVNCACTTSNNCGCIQTYAGTTTYGHNHAAAYGTCSSSGTRQFRPVRNFFGRLRSRGCH